MEADVETELWLFWLRIVSLKSLIFWESENWWCKQLSFFDLIKIPSLLDSLTSADYKLDLAEVRRKITRNTKMLVLNNPNNPTGKLYNREELEGLARIADEFDLLVLSDEVYEYHVFPGNEMIRFGGRFFLPLKMLWLLTHFAWDFLFNLVIDFTVKDSCYKRSHI